MDILQLMKENHDSLRRELALAQDFLAGSPAKSAKFLEAAKRSLAPLAKRIHLSLGIEADFLCPELEDRFPGSLVILDILEANQRVTRRLAGEIWLLAGQLVDDTDSLSSKVSGISLHLLKHLDAVEQLLMPKIRMHIATQEREDLGQVFSDVIEERSEDEVCFVIAKVKGAKLQTKSAAKVVPLQKKRRA